MKRVLAYVLAFVLCLSAMSFAVSAAGAQINMGSAQALPGEQITVNLSISDNPGIAYLKLKVSYDAESLALVGTENAGVLTGTYTTSKTMDTNPYVLQWMGAENAKGNGTIASLTFTVKETAKSGNYTVSITVEECYDQEFEDVALAAVSGEIEVLSKECIHTDKTETPAKSAECLQAGNHKYFTCDSCGAVFKADGITKTTAEGEVIPALGHDLSAADCVSAEKCRREGCGYVSGSALGHSFTDYKSNNDATCTADGTKTAKCERCDVTDTVADAGSAKGHSFVNDTCSVCGYEKAHTHNMTKTDAKAVTCTEAGNVTYYTCSGCGKLFADDKGEEEIVDVVLPALGHSFTNYKSNNDATCTEDGTKTAKCERCDVTDTVADAGSAKGHSFVGDTCTVCGFVQEHVHSMTKTEAVEATCHQNGNQEYWYCADCDSVFADAEGRYLTNRKNVIIPATKGLTYVPAAEGCHVPGTAEYWYCVECEAVFADAAGIMLTNRKNLETAPTCELVHMDAVDPCHNNGTLEYWFCPKCEAVFADAEGKQLTNRMNLTIPAIEGALQHFEAVAATKDKDGIQEHWYCEGCDCYFTDAEGKYNVAYKSLIIPAIEVPQTGDPIMLWVVLAVVSVMGVVCTVALGKRKFFA